MKQEPLSFRGVKSLGWSSKFNTLNLVKIIMALIIFTCFILIVAVGYLATGPKVEPVVLPPTEEESEIDISDWKTYKNEEYEFEMQYPEGWFFNDFSEKINDEITLSDIRFLSQNFKLRNVFARSPAHKFMCWTTKQSRSYAQRAK